MPPVTSIARICEGREIPFMNMGMGGEGCGTALTQLKTVTDTSENCFDTGLGVHMACLRSRYSESFRKTESRSQYEVQCISVTSKVEGMDPVVNKFVNKVNQRIMKVHGPDIVIPVLPLYSDYLKANNNITYCVSDSHLQAEIQRRVAKKAAEKAKKIERAEEAAKRAAKKAEDERLKEQRRVEREEKAAKKAAEKAEGARLNKEKRVKRQHTLNQRADEAKARLRAMGILK